MSSAPAPTRPHANAGKPPPFDAHQVEWIQDKSDFKVASKCRRSGFTFAEAFDAVKTRITGERVNDYWYSGLDESTAREFGQYCKFFAGTFGQLLEVYTGEEVIDGKSIKTFSVTLPPVTGPGGQVREPRITAMTSSPGNFRSKGGDVCLDELAKHPDQDELWAAAQGCAMRGGRVRIISTHPTSPNMFDEFVAMGVRRREGKPIAGDKPVSLHVVDLDCAIAGGLVERINWTEGTSWTREAYRANAIVMAGDRADTELFCKTGNQQESYLPFDLLRPCVIAGLPRWTDRDDVFFSNLWSCAAGADAIYAGSDVGRKSDRFTIVTGIRRGARVTSGPALAWQNRRFDDMEGVLDRLMRASIPVQQSGPRRDDRVRRLAIDEAGLGMQMAERLTTRFRARVEGVNTGVASVREDLWTRARAMFEERTAGLPDDADLLSQLNSVRRIQTAAKHDRYDIERNAKGHGDLATGFVLMLYAASQSGGRAFIAEGTWR